MGYRSRWSGRLSLKNYGRPTDSLAFEVDGHLYAVSDLDEGNAAIHPELLTVEGHCPIDRPSAGPLAGNGKCHLFGLGHTANGEVAVELNRSRAGIGRAHV